MASDGNVRYFCYGANMSATALKRRQVAPLASEAAVLHGWQFCMDYPGLPFIEPAFATVHPAPGACS